MRTIKLKEEAETVYNIFKGHGWLGRIGHIIYIDDISCSIVPEGEMMIVSDLLSGTKLFTVPIPNIEGDFSKEDSLDFMMTVVAGEIISFVKSIGRAHYKKRIEETAIEHLETFGPKPYSKPY